MIDNVFVFIEPRVEWNIFPDFEIASPILNEIKNKNHVDKLEPSDLMRDLVRNNKDIDFSKITDLLLEQLKSTTSTNVSEFGETNWIRF